MKPSSEEIKKTMNQESKKLDSMIKDEIEKHGKPELVVYILGAGFSAPLGIPVMSNFISKSKDQYIKDPEKYSYFKEVFNKFEELYKVLNYFSSDLNNIEEILSIIEMDIYLKSSDLKFDRDNYLKYLCDVIKFHTPSVELRPINRNSRHEWKETFLKDKKGEATSYIDFVAQLFDLEVSLKPENMIKNDFDILDLNSAKPKTLYSVVTLNYDTVLEDICASIKKAYKCDIKFRRFPSGNPNEESFLPYLSKLHGCISDTSIVPPTWAKSIENEKIREAWALARSLLANATHIRILGYSLPFSDNYIKYLFKSASISWYNLKSIDILCLDDELSSVKDRYSKLFKFKKHRYFNANIINYLAEMRWKDSTKPNKVIYQRLEHCHRSFIQNPINMV